MHENYSNFQPISKVLYFSHLIISLCKFLTLSWKMNHNHFCFKRLSYLIVFQNISLQPLQLNFVLWNLKLGQWKSIFVDIEIESSKKKCTKTELFFKLLLKLTFFWLTFPWPKGIYLTWSSSLKMCLFIKINSFHLHWVSGLYFVIVKEK